MICDGCGQDVRILTPSEKTGNIICYECVENEQATHRVTADELDPKTECGIELQDCSLDFRLAFREETPTCAKCLAALAISHSLFMGLL